MQSSQDFTPSQATAILLIGSPGTGKTTLALQFPKPYLFDADNNQAGPKRYLERKNINYHYDVGNVNSEGKEIKPFQRYQHMLKCLKQAGKSDEVETLVIDSLTSVQEYIKDDIFRQRVPNPGSRTPLITEDNRDRGQLTEPEWGIYARYLTTLITTLRIFPKIVVFTAHSESRQKGENGPWEDTIALQGMMRYKFAAHFSDCIELTCRTEGFGDKQKVVRKYRTLPSNDIDKRGLKTSFDLPPVFEDSEVLTKQFENERKI